MINEGLELHQKIAILVQITRTLIDSKREIKRFHGHLCPNNILVL